MTDVRIVRPDVTDPAQRGLVADWVEVRSAAQRHDLGKHASPFTLQEYLAFATSTSLRRIPHAALVDGVVVGGGNVALPVHDNRHAAYLNLEVHPEFRRRGVGTALIDAMEACAARAGRVSLMTETSWLADSPDADGDVAGEEFLRPRGYLPEITNVQQELSLTSAALSDQRDLEPDGYAVEVTWGPLPEAWLADRAFLATRMSTDSPSGGLDNEEERWDAERVRDEIRLYLDGGRERVEAVARHTASGRLVGYSYLAVSAATPDLAYQEDTLVIREHRGHGLGLRLKRATAAALLERLPNVRTIRTWNATTNGPMLDVNRELGFGVVAYECEWQRRLGPLPGAGAAP